MNAGRNGEREDGINGTATNQQHPRFVRTAIAMLKPIQTAQKKTEKELRSEANSLLKKIANAGEMIPHQAWNPESESSSTYIVLMESWLHTARDSIRERNPELKNAIEERTAAEMTVHEAERGKTVDDAAEDMAEQARRKVDDIERYAQEDVRAAAVVIAQLYLIHDERDRVSNIQHSFGLKEEEIGIETRSLPALRSENGTSHKTNGFETNGERGQLELVQQTEEIIGDLVNLRRQ